MTTDSTISGKHYALLTAQTPRLPAYLAPATEIMTSRADAIASRVASFLHAPVRISDITARRTAATDISESTDEPFDILDETGSLAMRVTLSTTTVATVTRSLFGGEVTEKAVLAGVAQAFCQRIATAALGHEADAEEMPEPDFTVRRADPEAIGTRPVLALDLNLALMNPPGIEILIEVPRPYTDRLSAPNGHLGDNALKTLSFPITAIAGRTRLPLREIMGWQKGSVIQLPGASIETVAAVVTAGPHKVTVAKGELGVHESRKSLRLNEILRPDGQQDGMAMTG